MLLFIHGFLSSSQSGKAQTLKRWLEEQGRADEWCCPDLPIDPAQAMDLLRQCIREATGDVTLIGSSLGGFYATVLSEEFGVKAVLINPAVEAGRLLEGYVGEHKAWHSDDVMVFTQAHVDTLKSLQVKEITDPNRVFLMVEKEDEVIDYTQAVTFYRDCHQLIFNGGDHSFTRFKQVLPFIDQF
ncbi:MAG: esterase [Alcaligenaceae bacterium]|nr:esterase [Alcaligenaceae bacterium]